MHKSRYDGKHVRADTRVICCNVMIKGHEDHRLHVTYQLHPFVLKSYMPQTHLPRHHYKLFFVLPYHRYNLISLVLTRPPIRTSSFWSRSPMCYMWAKQAICFNFWLMRKDYLQTNAFPNLVVVKREEYPHALQKKTTGGRVTSKVVRRRLAGHSQTWLLGRQHQLLPDRPGGRITSQCLAVTMQG